MDEDSCTPPEAMDIFQLKKALRTRGKSVYGDRDTLTRRYLSRPKVK